MADAQPSDVSGPRYKRILLKLSGEALMGRQQHGIDPAVVVSIADQVKAIREMNVEVGLVIDGVEQDVGVDDHRASSASY